MPEQRPEDRRPTGASNTTVHSLSQQLQAAPATPSLLHQEQEVRGLISGVRLWVQSSTNSTSQGLDMSIPSPELDEAEVLFSEIELGPRIGVGCFGEVFKARWRQTTVAVKRLFDQSLAESTLRVRSRHCIM